MNDQKSVVIFGTGKVAEVAFHSLMNDSEYNVVGFTVEAAFLPNPCVFRDLPVVAFETLEDQFSPKLFYLFAPTGGDNLNLLRERIYLQGKRRGYRFATYISSKANIDTPLEKIGENCYIMEFNNVQYGVSIGNNCVLWSGNHIGHHTTIADHVFIASHVCVSGMCTIKNNSFLGVNSSLRDGVTIAEGTVVAMQCAITKDTEAFGVYTGVPGKLLKKLQRGNEEEK